MKYEMIIENCNLDDYEQINHLYEQGGVYQREKNQTSAWVGFDKDLVEREIKEKRQWKLLIDNEIAIIWVVNWEDKLIWEEKEKNDAIYLHRIATNPKFRGQKLLNSVIEWSIGYAKEKQKKFLRMDTSGENKPLVAYYEKCGFDFLGLKKMENTHGLPLHYQNVVLALFEIKL